MSAAGRQAAFVVVALVACWLAAFGVVTIVTGNWAWLLNAVLALGAAAAIILAVVGLFALAERLFPDGGVRG